MSLKREEQIGVDSGFPATRRWRKQGPIFEGGTDAAAHDALGASNVHVIKVRTHTMVHCLETWS